MSFIMNSDKVYFLCLFDLLVTGVVVTVVSAWLEGGGGVVVVVARIYPYMEGGGGTAALPLPRPRPPLPLPGGALVGDPRGDAAPPRPATPTSYNIECRRCLSLLASPPLK